MAIILFFVYWVIGIIIQARKASDEWGMFIVNPIAIVAIIFLGVIWPILAIEDYISKKKTP